MCSDSETRQLSLSLSFAFLLPSPMSISQQNKVSSAVATQVLRCMESVYIGSFQQNLECKYEVYVYSFNLFRVVN